MTAPSGLHLKVNEGTSLITKWVSLHRSTGG